MSFFTKSLGVFGTRIFKIGLSLVSSIIVTRVLGPTNRGAMELLIVVPHLMAAFGNLGIGNANLYFIAKKKYSIEKIIGNSFSISLLLGSILLVFSLFLAFLTADTLFRNIPFYYCYISFTVLPLLLFHRFTEYTLLGKESVNLRNQLNIFLGVFEFILVIFLVVVLKWNVLGVISTQLFSNILTFFFGVYLLSTLSKLQVGFDTKLFIEAVKYGIIPFLALFILNLNFKADLFLIKYFLDNTQVGFYSLGVSLTEKLWLVPEAVSLVLFSRVSNIEEREADILTPKLCRITLLFSVITSLFLLATGSFVIQLLYGHKFRPSIPPFFILLPGTVAMTLYLLLHSDLTGRGKAKITLKIFSWALGLNIILNIILIPLIGINGAALASTVSYTLGALGLTYKYSKIHQIPLKTILLFKKSDYVEYVVPLLIKIKSYFAIIINNR